MCVEVYMLPWSHGTLYIMMYIVNVLQVYLCVYVCVCVCVSSHCVTGNFATSYSPSSAPLSPLLLFSPSAVALSAANRLRESKRLSSQTLSVF